MTSKQAVTHVALSLGADLPADSDSDGSDFSDDKKRQTNSITWGVMSKKGQEACDRDLPTGSRRFAVACVCYVSTLRLPGSNSNESFHRSLDNYLPRVAG